MRRVPVLISVLAVVLAGLFGVGLTATLAQPATPAPTWGTAAAATMQDTAGKMVGTALLAERPDGTVYVSVVALGLVPGDHGIHAHETGACDPAGDKPFTSAGGHFNPTEAEHGAHAGDLGNATANADGLAKFELTTDRFALATGATPLLDSDGAAIVLHANPDENDPEGKSFGGRIACGVLTTVAAPAMAGTAPVAPSA
ncbi:MAG: superoxide dismutase family protein [Chloroflexota bacterium]|nr:superoxide dismutase family protein [Chloroflexota bacterium]